jgi:hypothetical protein
MKTAHAPSELPFVPKPYNNELFSSWMLRIAHANCVSLQELVLGFQCHPDLSIPDSLEWGFSPAYMKAMAQFSRTPVSKLVPRKSSLRQVRWFRRFRVHRTWSESGAGE